MFCQLRSKRESYGCISGKILKISLTYGFCFRARSDRQVNTRPRWPPPPPTKTSQRDKTVAQKRQNVHALESSFCLVSHYLPLSRFIVVVVHNPTQYGLNQLSCVTRLPCGPSSYSATTLETFQAHRCITTNTRIFIAVSSTLVVFARQCRTHSTPDTSSASRVVQPPESSAPLQRSVTSSVPNQRHRRL